MFASRSLIVVATSTFTSGTAAAAITTTATRNSIVVVVSSWCKQTCHCYASICMPSGLKAGTVNKSTTHETKTTNTNNRQQDTIQPTQTRQAEQDN